MERAELATGRLPDEGAAYQLKRIIGIMGTFRGGHFELGKGTVAVLNNLGDGLIDSQLQLEQWGCDTGVLES